MEKPFSDRGKVSNAALRDRRWGGHKERGDEAYRAFRGEALAPVLLQVGKGGTRPCACA